MLYYALCLSYRSNTEAALFACLSFGWATTTGRLLGSKAGNSISCLSQGHSDVLPHRELNQGFATFRLLARRHYLLSHAAASRCSYFISKLDSYMYHIVHSF